MSRTSKIKFDPRGDVLYISHPDWEFLASATLRADYADEIQSVNWSKNGDYLYSQQLKCYLHIYIIKNGTAKIFMKQ